MGGEVTHEDLAHFGTELLDKITKALAPPAPAGAPLGTPSAGARHEHTLEAPSMTEFRNLQKSVGTMSQRLDALLSLLKPGENGQPDGELLKALNGMKETIDTHHVVIDKALDRISGLEGHTVTRKSIQAEDGDTGEGRQLVSKSVSGGGAMRPGLFDNVVHSLWKGERVQLG